jgi:hypothetical protein
MEINPFFLIDHFYNIITIKKDGCPFITDIGLAVKD